MNKDDSVIFETAQELHPKRCKKTKWLSEEALQIAEKEKKLKAKEKRKDIPI